MPLSSFRTERLINIIDTILGYKIAHMFSEPVDPERDQCPTYLTVVKKPMDLGTIRNKLVNNEYDYVSEFNADVELVWSNAILFNGKTSFIAILVRQLQMVFKDLSEFLTDNERDDWINQMNDLRSKVNNLITNPCKKIIDVKNGSGNNIVAIAPVLNITSSSVNYNDNDPNYDSSDDEMSSSSSFSRLDTKSKSSSKRGSGSSSKSHSRSTNSSGNSSKNSHHKDKSHSSNKEKSSSSKNRSHTKVVIEQTYNNESGNEQQDENNVFTEDEIEQLANDVNKVAEINRDNMDKIINLLSEMEPELEIKDELELENIKKETKKALRKLVNELL